MTFNLIPFPMNSLRIRSLAPLIVLLLFLSSCKVTLVPPYNAAILEQIDQTTKEIDKFYLLMLETTSTQNGGRSYEQFAEQYVDIEVELVSLLNKNKIRPLNANSVRICEITLQLWTKYKEEHRTDNPLSDGLIKLNRKTLGDLLFAMQVAEKAKEIANSSPSQQP